MDFGSSHSLLLPLLLLLLLAHTPHALTQHTITKQQPLHMHSTPQIVRHIYHTPDQVTKHTVTHRIHHQRAPELQLRQQNGIYETPEPLETAELEENELTTELASEALEIEERFNPLEMNRAAHYAFMAYDRSTKGGLATPIGIVMSAGDDTESAQYFEGQGAGLVLEIVIDYIPRNIRAYIGTRRKRGEVIIAFRGTEILSTRNWGTNFHISVSEAHNFVPNYPDKATMQSHSGFLRGYSAIRDQVVKKAQGILLSFNESGIQNRTLLITGHSLGGALATLCAGDFGEIRKHSDTPGDYLIKLYTFGSPPIGTESFLDEINDVVPFHFSVENSGDPVPDAPWYFYHLDNQVLFEEPESKEPSMFGRIYHSVSSFFSKLFGRPLIHHSGYVREFDTV